MLSMTRIIITKKINLKMSDEKKRVVVAYTETEANTIRIEELEKKENRDYGNINELRRQIEVNDKEIAEIKDNHTALEYICKFMFNKVAQNLEKIEEDK